MKGLSGVGSDGVVELQLRTAHSSIPDLTSLVGLRQSVDAMVASRAGRGAEALGCCGGAL